MAMTVEECTQPDLLQHHPALTCMLVRTCVLLPTLASMPLPLHLRGGSKKHQIHQQQYHEWPYECAYECDVLSLYPLVSHPCWLLVIELGLSNSIMLAGCVRGSFTAVLQQY